jgi:lambda family phage portal protein
MGRAYPSLTQRGFVMPTRLKASAAYESGSSSGSRTRNWQGSGVGPNFAAAQNLPLMRGRARDAVRNDPWAKTSVARFVSNVIGTGIQPHPKHPDPAVRKALKQWWDDWASEADADGLLDVYGLQTLAATSFFTDGEAFTRLVLRRPSADLPVPLQLRQFESDFVPAEKNQVLANGAEIVSGVEFDADANRVAYHMWRRHPGEYGRPAQGGQALVRVLADEIIHVFKPVRPGQVRGVTELATILLRLKSLDNFDDAVLFRQELANLFAGFITRKHEDGGDGVPPLNQLSGAEEQFDSDGFTPIASLEPGTLQQLGDDEEIKFSTPPGAGTDYAPFMRQQLMAAAASVGFPYEVLTGDLREVNDRVLRVILNEFRRGIEQLQWNVFIHQYCRRVWAAWIDALALSGAMPMPDFYRTRREYLRVRWVPQGWPYMQPVQDMQAKRMAVRAGFTSRSAVVLEQGDDPETIDEENAMDNARADAQQLRYDSDARVLDVKGDPTDSTHPTDPTKDIVP